MGTTTTALRTGEHSRAVRAMLLAIYALLAVALAARAQTPSPSNRPYQTVASANGALEIMLTAQESPLTFGDQTWSAMLYNGAYLPPVLRVQPGDSLKLHLVNRLASDQMTNMHYHGTAVSPKPPSDYVLMMVHPSTSFDYKLSFPPNHDRGLFWYHPHAHGQSEEQVQDGMSGLLVVEGFLETNYPWLRDVPERLLMLKDLEPPGHPDSLGHVKNINGEVSASFTIRPGELQFWRIGNIAADGYFNLKIDGHRLWLLASDANAVRRPTLVDSLFLPPGARAEVLIEGGAPGRYPIRHLTANTGPAGDPNPAARLGTLVVQGERVDRTADVQRLRTMADLPDVTKEIADLRAHLITRRRTFVFSETADGDTFFINGQQFNPDSVNSEVNVGDVEEWTLINTTGEWHAFHIHQLDFLVTEINGVAQPGNSFHDTVNLPFLTGSQPGIVKVIVPFTDPNIVGKFVYHCHILEHEDGGMMQVIQVHPANWNPTTAAAPASSGSTADSSGTVSSSASGNVQSAVDSLYPVRLLDRPVTLPRGAARLDLFALGSRQPASPTAWTTILGGGVGVTRSLEVGGQIVPLAVSTGTAKFTNPSIYTTYTFSIRNLSLAPTAQAVFPLADDDPFFVDLGVPMYYNIGTIGYVAFAPTFSVDTRENGAGTSLSFPVTFVRQVTEQFNWQLSSGVGLARFDPRFGLSRRTESIEFDDTTIPLSASAMYTLEHGHDRRPLVDVTVQFQWPQLYTRVPGQRGTNTDDWAAQVQTSWYFLP
jgi:FtsP/CotA-like multicopper oxidase with cupredoxin domain